MEKVNFLGKEFALLGKNVQLGETVEIVATPAGSFEDVAYENNQKHTVVVVFPSIDTRVCDMQVVASEALAKEYPNVNFVSVSVDLPTALASYQDQHKIEHIKMFSDYKHREISTKLGLLIDKMFLSARAMLVLDQNYKLVYKQVNENVHEQVDFESLRRFLNNL